MTPIRLTAAVRLTAASSTGPRRLFILAYTGDVMRVSGFGPIVIDLAGLALPGSLPILADHRNELAQLIGTGNPASDGKALTVSATVADTDPGREVVALLEGGHGLAASVGCEPFESEYIRPGESVSVNGRMFTANDDGFRLIKRAALREVSVLPIGADSSASVSLAARAAKGNAMNFRAMLKAAGTTYTDEEIDAMSEDEAKAALKKCMGTTEPPKEEEKPADAAAYIPILANTSPELLIRCEREKWSLTRVKAEALAHLRAARPSFGHVGGGSGNGSASGDDHLAAALLVKAGYEKLAEKSFGPRDMEMSRPMHRASFREIMASAAQLHGIDPGGSRGDVDTMLRAGGASSAWITNILSNAANKVLEMTWREAPSTWRSFCTIKSAANFKTHTSLRPAFTGNLTEVFPNGEVQHGQTEEWLVQWSVKQFAKQYHFNRVQIINDDLSALTEALPSFARAAARTLNDLVYAVLMTNAGSFFHTDNANTQSGGDSALSAQSLSVAVQQLRKQRNPEGGYLDLTPAVLVVPPSLETTARELLNSVFLFRDQADDKQGSANAFQGIAALEVEPRLENGALNPVYQGQQVSGSATRWYLFSAPINMPMLVGFLDGREAPIIQTFDIAQNPDGLYMILRAVHDFGAALGDPRAAQNSAGA